MSRFGLPVAPERILDHTSDGIYVVDPSCRILFWNKPAERITGWRAEEVVGKRCSEDILVHVDSHGRPLCSPDHCPLHKAIATGMPAGKPYVLYAKCRDGRRIPVSVTVAPLRDDSGHVIGGVEVFRDESQRMEELAAARRIQQHALEQLPPPGKVRFEVLYKPYELLGGDYYRAEQLEGGRYGFIVADVCGHGLAAALYTMTLHTLWRDSRHLLVSPGLFLGKVGRTMGHLLVEDSFTTAFLGLLEPASGRLIYSSAGHPPAFLRRAGGGVQRLMALEPPLGLPGMDRLEEASVELGPGDMLVITSDGAVEARSPAGEEFGIERLEQLVMAADPGDPRALLREIDKALMIHVGDIVLDDDMCVMVVVIQE